jgi:hypothetical protein
MIKNVWQCCKQIWTHFFSAVTYYVINYYRFLNTDPATMYLLISSWLHRYIHTWKWTSVFAYAVPALTVMPITYLLIWYIMQHCAFVVGVLQNHFYRISNVIHKWVYHVRITCFRMTCFLKNFERKPGSSRISVSSVIWSSGQGTIF